MDQGPTRAPQLKRGVRQPAFIRNERRNDNGQLQPRCFIVFGPWFCGFWISRIGAPSFQREADLIRATERQRLRALVEANIKVARQLHADDFQLINPVGESFTKEQYLGGIASGQLDYLVWEPESPIEVRLYGRAAVIRYRSQLEIVVQGEKIPLQRYWHTDSYEKRNGRWQVVWSQATRIS